jgi:hypothetical protein
MSARQAALHFGVNRRTVEKILKHSVPPEPAFMATTFAPKEEDINKGDPDDPTSSQAATGHEPRCRSQKIHLGITWQRRQWGMNRRVQMLHSSSAERS